MTCRYEILLIAYRKPEWDWSQEIARAGSVLDNSTGSFVPVPSAAPPPIDPDRMLFSMQWIDMAFAGGGGAGMPGRGGGREYGRGGRGRGGRGDGGEAGGRGPPPGGARTLPPAPQSDYYGGDLNGYVIDGNPQYMDEAMAR